MKTRYAYIYTMRFYSVGKKNEVMHFHEINDLEKYYIRWDDPDSKDKDHVSSEADPNFFICMYVFNVCVCYVCLCTQM